MTTHGNVQVELSHTSLDHQAIGGSVLVDVFARSGSVSLVWTHLGKYDNVERNQHVNDAVRDAILFAENTARALGVDCCYGNANLEATCRALFPDGPNRVKACEPRLG